MKFSSRFPAVANDNITKNWRQLTTTGYATLTGLSLVLIYKYLFKHFI